MRFNTNRSYDKNGQIIDATQLSDGRVHFVDLSRCIDGVLRCAFNERDILRAYDTGDYYDNYIDVNEQIALGAAARALHNEYNQN